MRGGTLPEAGETITVPVGLLPSTRLSCPECQTPECTIKDRRERTWRHLDTCQYKTLVNRTAATHRLPLLRGQDHHAPEAPEGGTLVGKDGDDPVDGADRVDLVDEWGDGEFPSVVGKMTASLAGVAAQERADGSAAEPAQSPLRNGLHISPIGGSPVSWGEVFPDLR